MLDNLSVFVPLSPLYLHITGFLRLYAEALEQARLYSLKLKVFIFFHRGREREETAETR